MTGLAVLRLVAVLSTAQAMAGGFAHLLAPALGALTPSLLAARDRAPEASRAGGSVPGDPDGLR